MKLIHPSWKIIEQGSGLQGIYEQIELAGRTCYASTHKITYQENDECTGQYSITAKDFVDRMINSKHLSMLEHGTVYLAIPHNPFSNVADSTFRYRYNPYSRVNNAMPTKPDICYVTTNYRVLVENSWLNDLQYLCEPTEYHEKRVTVKFITGIDISRELNRHRVNSMAEQSTRYCNYSKEKFGEELTCILPSWINISEGKYDFVCFWDEETTKRVSKEIGDTKEFDNIQAFITCLNIAELNYFALLKGGWKPEQARKVLPLDLATELVHTAFVSDWKHLFSLRSSDAATGRPHPDCIALIDPLKEEFIKRNYI